MEKATVSAVCWNVLVVTLSAAEEVAEFIVLTAESVCRAMLLETNRATHLTAMNVPVMFSHGCGPQSIAC